MYQKGNAQRNKGNKVENPKHSLLMQNKEQVLKNREDLFYLGANCEKKKCAEGLKDGNITNFKNPSICKIFRYIVE